MAVMVTRSSLPPFEEYCEEIKELWKSRWLTNNGKKHQLFEKQLKDYLHTRNVELYANGHLALEAILEAMNFERGQEVITTPFTFASTTHAIVRRGLIPVFCDIKYDDYTLDDTKLEKLITKKTCAVLPIHVYGNVCNIEAIQCIADKYSLKVIYDAAHAFGVKYKGNSIANFGDASMFSFHATKVFNTIEGGAVCYCNDALTSMLKGIKNFGIKNAEHVYYEGGNGKMNEFEAAMGICNLRYLEHEILKRKKVAEEYQRRLAHIEGIKTCFAPDNVKSNYAYFPVLFKKNRFDRNRVFDRLAEENIYARKYFYPLTNEMMCYKKRFLSASNCTPIAKTVSESILCLPMYADLPLETVNHICDIILKECVR